MSHRSDARVHDALLSAGDNATALLWRRLCGELDGSLRIGIAGADGGLVDRVARHLPAGVRAVPIVLDGDRPSSGARVDLSADLALLDRLLGVHALVFATAVATPLTATEREALVALAEAGAPAERAVVVGDAEILARMSDDPGRELAEILDRVRTLLPAGWTLVAEEALAETAEAQRARRDALAATRSAEVGRVLLRDAERRSALARDHARDELERVDRLLAADAAALAEARRSGARIAAHLLSAARRQTERLLVDLSGFLARLEADLPAQTDAIADLDTLRRTLPHWLHHVIEGWMTARVRQWRRDVDDDLRELGISADDLARADLLVPALHGHLARSETGWASRLGVTAAMGGGAALLAFGLWIPGLLALTGGFVWSALGRRAERTATRRSLVEAAVDAVRKMGRDADRFLREQIEAIEGALQTLGDERAHTLEAAGAAGREALRAERTLRAVRLRDAEATRAALAAAAAWEDA